MRIRICQLCYVAVVNVLQEEVGIETDEDAGVTVPNL